MGFFLSPLFSTREAEGSVFPSFDARRAYVELISFAFPSLAFPCSHQPDLQLDSLDVAWQGERHRCPQHLLHSSHLQPCYTAATAPVLQAKYLEEQTRLAARDSQLNHHQQGENGP